MTAPPTRRPPVYWLFLIFTGLGVFAGTFWFFLGLLLLLGNHPVPWQVAATLAPGAGIVFLVLMARHHPRPYGVGLMVLGALPVLLTHFSTAWHLRLGFGLPLLAVGLGLVLTERGAPPAAGDRLHG
jgi:hypothetical protein